MKKKRAHFITMLILLMLLLFAFIMTGMSLSMKQTETSMEDTLTKQAEDNREQQAKTLTNLLLTSRNILGNFMYDDDIYRILKTEGVASPQNIRTIRSKLRMSQTMYLDDITYRIILLDLHGNVYTSIFNTVGLYDEIMSLEKVQNAILNHDSVIYIRCPLWFRNEDFASARVNTFSIVNSVLDQYGSKTIGLLLLSVSEQSILDSFERDGPVLAVNGSDGSTLFGSMDDALFQLILSDAPFSDNGLAKLEWNGQQYLISKSHVKNGDVYLYQAIAYDEVYAELIRMRQTNTAIMLALLFAIALILLAVILFITLPLHRLNKQISHLNINEDGNIPLMKVKGFQEFADIANAINDMSERTMTMFRVINEQRQKQEELNYRYLLSQLDPHFLLNTLNNIKWSAYMSNAHHVAEMITALGFILETSLGKQQGEVTVGHEADHVKNYMLLQEMHFGSEVSYSLAVEENVRGIPIERFILQTLVGNSIKHGYVKGKQMHIDIRIFVQNNQLHFIVRDDGKGIPDAQLQQIRNDLQNYSFGEKSTHIGLRNLNQRLKYRYGENAHLYVESKENTGTVITLTISMDALTGERNV